MLLFERIEQNKTWYNTCILVVSHQPPQHSLQPFKEIVFTIWSGFAADLVRKNLPPSTNTAKGHMNQESHEVNKKSSCKHHKIRGFLLKFRNTKCEIKSSNLQSHQRQKRVSWTYLEDFPIAPAEEINISP